MDKLEHNPSSVTNLERIREIVSEACRPIGPYWPMKTFAYYNPIRDLEDLPFAQAIQEAERLLGGKGFLSLEEYRRLFHEGRITSAAIERALQRVGPPCLLRPPCESERVLFTSKTFGVFMPYTALRRSTPSFSLGQSK